MMFLVFGMGMACCLTVLNRSVLSVEVGLILPLLVQ